MASSSIEKLKDKTLHRFSDVNYGALYIDKEKKSKVECNSLPPVKVWRWHTIVTTFLFVFLLPKG